MPRLHSRVRFVVEGANGPTTPDGDAALEDRGITIIPDVVANVGGVICSYFEQVQSNTGRYWTREDVLSALDERIARIVDDVTARANHEGVSLRDAAYRVAISRVAEACSLRGWV